MSPEHEQSSEPLPAPAAEHYFSATSQSELRTREITVQLAGAPREVVTANAVFSPQHLDGGTEVLLKNIPEPPETGTFLDLGCGWGPIALHLALSSPAATVWAVDVNERALTLVRTNAARLGLTNVIAAFPQDVPADIRFDTIWSNPPIRVGKEMLHDIMLTWLPRLKADTTGWLVVQRNLGSDSLHRWLEAELPGDFEVTRDTISKGFRVLRVDRD
ncbi:methyltransferase domain-containing protein [Cryobacterium melibiosiphilum]|uniref:Methyltransferase domain-containing protein n=1 Tax=Cryobacterium melibiosiphilum TaxID=995039 RepID=A0A3A5MM58_9MICO|nr:methyltransferase [Cryobacterium melibiosiphilum]RJT88929.1 methyltransferase domain-containing protein [Cryobacterium melibiosiphilum]